ncbi:hypothetical protein MMC16_005738 [Acarospora aff. strigata]|nr:hypothetical protein [Acarospora aff. strigata]
MEASSETGPTGLPIRKTDPAIRDASPTASSQTSSAKEIASPVPEFKPDWRLYTAFLTLSVMTLMVALDATALSVALPIIASKLKGSAIEAFWSGTSFLLASMILQPSYASFSHIFGRKPMVLVSLVFFLIGALVGALAKNFTHLLVGRSIQGVGGGGIMVLSEIIVTDLIPLRFRGNWFAIIAAMWALGTVSGPLVGGAFAQKVSWRWIFWINLPFLGAAFILVPLFLKLNFKPGRLSEQLMRVDWVGSVIFVGSATSFLIPISWGGVMYDWDSWRTLVPLLIGAAGLVAFGFYERFIAVEPLIRLHVFHGRTAIVSYLGSVVHGMILWSLLYYLPLYYEVVKGLSPILSGVALFPQTFTVAPASIVVGIIVTMTGRYRWAIWAGWILTTLGCGLLYLLDVNTTTAAWIFLNLVVGLGTGMLFPSMQFAIQAASSNADLAFAVSMFTFSRSFGQALGVAIGGVIFQNQMRSHLQTYPSLAPHATAYSRDASSLVQIVHNMPIGNPDRRDLVQSYADALKTVWIVMCALAAVAMVASAWTEGLDLNRALETEQGFLREEKGRGGGKEEEEGRIGGEEEGEK